MKIPKTFFIGQREWKVVDERNSPVSPALDVRNRNDPQPVSFRRGGIHGICLKRDHVIVLGKHLRGKFREHVFVHELLHALVPEKKWPAKREEDFVEFLAPRLLRALKGIGWTR